MKEDKEPFEISILSFFSGGGFLDMGFEQAGFQIVFSNEIDVDFAKFYKEGMSSWSGKPKKVTSVGDINKIPTESIKKTIPKKFGIIGGPPCQDFSIRGSKNGFDGLRGTLTYHFYERIMDLGPDFFLMENVPGLVKLKKTKEAFNQILEMFSEEYFITSKHLNALHYGLPQNRERLFVFGVKRNLINQSLSVNKKDFGFKWPTPLYPNAEINFNWGEPKNRNFQQKGLELPLPPPLLCVDGILINEDQKNITPNAGEYFNLLNIKKIKQIVEGDTYRPSFKRLHRLKYSPTVCYGNNEVHLHPFLNRRLSVREALRLQGVPDSYVLSTPGKLTKKFKMIGNGVPVTLSNQVALSIKKFLITLERENEKVISGKRNLEITFL